MPGVPLGDAGVAARLLEVPARAVVALGGLLGGGRGVLGVEVGLHQLGLDPGHVVGGLRDPVPGVVHLLLARVHVVAARRGRRGRGGDPGEPRDQGEGEGGDADSMHGWSS